MLLPLTLVWDLTGVKLPGHRKPDLDCKYRGGRQKDGRPHRVINLWTPAGDHT